MATQKQVADVGTSGGALEYEVVIGLEVHSQLSTDSKMFCSCDAGYQHAPPNTSVCEVCMGMPGVLPVINKRAVELVIATGIALDCTILKYTKFDRKNYPYPDLMKGYQISQFDQPIAQNGLLAIDTEDGVKNIGITRVHLEEDVAKLMHRTSPDGEPYSLLDINRAGVPLMEIVSEPDMSTADEARTYLTALRSILRYIDVSTANMEEGSFRCDANISVRPQGSTDLGVKVEVKNMNSFRSVHDALEYEVERQTRLARAGERIVQETRGWNQDRAVSVSQRSKEGASDYRYFPEPDLPPLLIRSAWVRRITAGLPELPGARTERFVKQYGLPSYDAKLLTSSKSTADYFESVMKSSADGASRQVLAKSVSNWMSGELARSLNETGGEVDSLKFRPKDLVELVDMVDSGLLSGNMAKTVFTEMFESGVSPKQIAEDRGLAQMSDTDSVTPAVDEAIESNPDAVQDYLDGKDAALRYLMGQVMKITRGQANPQITTALLTEKLESMR